MNIVYKLIVEKEERNDMDHDAVCLPFEGEDMLGANMMDIDDFEHPDTLYFLANFDYIPERDYVDNDVLIPIMSSKLLDLIRGLGAFHLSIIPVNLIDDTYFGERFDVNGSLLNEVPFNGNFGAVQFKQYTEAFDYDKSDFITDELFPEDVSFVRKHVLRTPENGFPAIFKIKEDLRYIFVDHRFKSACEMSGLKGCNFQEVEVSS